VPSTTTRQAWSWVRLRIQVRARRSPAALVGKVRCSTTAPVAPISRVMVRVAAWVSTPTTRAYSSATVRTGDLLSANGTKCRPRRFVE
jgi:hypothetical protein